MAQSDKLQSDRVAVQNSLEEVNELIYERGWSDGLPVVPPTEERVLAMLNAVDRDPQEVLGLIPPAWAEATIEKIAINAVMAGCLPEYMPVLIAAVEAIADERFNLYAIQATTNPVAPLLVINGPIAEHLDLNSGFGCFGPGWRSNATIGRAIRLILMNVGGGRPGHGDMADQGQPGKYSFCIAENEKESPWPPLHVERGFDPNTSTVTAIAVVSVLNIMVLAAKRAAEVLPEIVGSMTALGTNNLYNGGDPTLALCPEHAEVIARDRFSKDDVKHYIFEHARVPLSKLSPDNAAIIRHHREKAIPWAFQQPEPLIPIADRPEDIIIIVAGARGGPHSSYVSTFGNQPSVTKAISL